MASTGFALAPPCLWVVRSRRRVADHVGKFELRLRDVLMELLDGCEGAQVRQGLRLRQL